MHPPQVPEAPRAGASAFPGEAAFTWDPEPWPGHARMDADRAARAKAERILAQGGRFVPRMAWWTWDRPTLSLGRLQAEQAIVALGLPVVRRPTGGGAILHDAEWTCSVLVPRDHAELGGSLDVSTRAIVRVVAAALAVAYGIAVDPWPAVGAPRGGAGGPPAACFARTFGYELAVGGRKLLGSAQRRGRHALLQQGSLLVGPGHQGLARHLRAAQPGDEAALAARAVTLTELLGRTPDPEPFRRALSGAWTEAASGRCESAAPALDSAGGRT